MLATGAVAVALALARWGNPWRRFDPGGEFNDSLYLGILFVYSAIVALLAAVSLLPCVWAGLRKSVSPAGIAIAAAIHFALVFVPLLIIEVVSFGMWLPAEFWAGSFLFIGGYFMIVMVVLRICRHYGYCLRWRRE